MPWILLLFLSFYKIPAKDILLFIYKSNVHKEWNEMEIKCATNILLKIGKKRKRIHQLQKSFSGVSSPPSSSTKRVLFPKSFPQFITF